MSKNQTGIYEYQGKDYTLTELAEMLGTTRQSIHGRIRRHGIDEAVRISKMSDKELKEWRHQQHKDAQHGNRTTINYRGQMISHIYLAGAFGVKVNRLKNWIAQYGEHNAFLMLEADEDQRLILRRQLRGKSAPKPAHEVQLPSLDPDLELKRRIEAYKAQGWSDDEILIKLRIAA